ncbi:MAG: DUF4115 domain-containing protein [Alphaproteobacteria bacterium]|nr:DUF4115 domain-containing protein [Alphaproteobacteria bacterium]
MSNKENMTAAEMLYAARTNSRKPRELPVIAKKLCIREDFLEALETGNYSALSENVYILGFARNYAIELGLDPAVISKKLKEELGITTMEIPPESTVNDPHNNQREVHAPIASSGGATETVDPMESAFRRQKSNAKKMWALAAVLALIAAGGIGGYFMAGTKTVPTEALVQPASEENAQAKIEFSVPVKFEYGVENRDTARIVMQAVAETWLKVERNGEIIFSRVLMPGDVYFAPNRQGIRATIGNAGGLDIWVAGKLAPKLGAMHTRVTDVPLTEEGILNRRPARAAPRPAPAPEPAAE